MKEGVVWSRGRGSAKGIRSGRATRRQQIAVTLPCALTKISLGVSSHKESFENGHYVKKTANIALALLGTTVLASCTPQGDVQTGAFKDVDQCVASGKFTVRECTTSFTDASRERRLNGPSYATRDECLRNNEDGCEDSTSAHAAGSGRYIPSSAYYMVGRNSRTENGTYYPAVQSQPLYDQPGKGLVSNAGETVASKSGIFSLSPKSSSLSRSSSVRTTTVGRSGFGHFGGVHGVGG